MTEGGKPTSGSTSRRAVATATVSLLAACVFWAIALSHLFRCDTQHADRRETLGESLQLSARAAEQSLPFDAAGLVAGAAAGFALVRVGQLGRRRLMASGAVLWVLVMGTNVVVLAVHLFLMCLPTLYMLGILSELQVAG